LCPIPKAELGSRIIATVEHGVMFGLIHLSHIKYSARGIGRGKSIRD